MSNNPLKDLQDALEKQIYGSTEAGHCVDCKKPFTSLNVHTQAGWRETKLSKLCEDCWNDLFAEGDQ